MSSTAVAHLGEAEAHLPAASGETAAVLSMIERAARDPAVDIEKLERLMAMQERLTAARAETAFNVAMQAAQAELPRVTRDAVNSHTRSRYARLESIHAAIKPVVTKHGFSLSFGTDTSPVGGHYRVTCTVAHRDGHSRTVFADIPIDGAGAKGAQNKTATHAFGSTMSYGRRYLVLLVFDIALTDEDDDGNRAGEGALDVITTAQAERIRKLVEEVGADLHKFLAHIDAESVPDILARDYERAVRLLEKKRGQ